MSGLTSGCQKGVWDLMALRERERESERENTRPKDPKALFSNEMCFTEVAQTSTTT